MKKILRVISKGAMLYILFMQVLNSQAQQANKPTEKPFSFVVYGDSRSMMDFPYKQDQEAETRKLLVEMFSLVLPQKVAEEVIQKNVKLTYDPSSHELIQVVMPFMTSSEIMTLKVDKGWITEASVEDVKLLPGVSRTMFRLEGGQWIHEQIVREVKSGQAKFILNSGDLVWWGSQADKPSDNPYWKLFHKTVFDRLPAPDRDMRDQGLEGRYYISAGNHETWADSSMEGMLTTFPYLKKYGVSPTNLIYKFDFDGVRFIFLWTGRYDYRQPGAWVGTRPPYEDQMKQLTVWLDEAKIAGIHKVFISFHNPVYSRMGFGGINENENPRAMISSYAKDLDIVVFNGHVHTTQIFQVDGVKYLLTGGGGAEQDPILPGRTQTKVPDGYPEDLYWKGEPPIEEYNYVRVDVLPGQPTKFTINRFRPGSSEPYASIDLNALFSSSK